MNYRRQFDGLKLGPVQPVDSESSCDNVSFNPNHWNTTTPNPYQSQQRLDHQSYSDALTIENMKRALRFQYSEDVIQLMTPDNIVRNYHSLQQSQSGYGSYTDSFGRPHIPNAQMTSFLTGESNVGANNRGTTTKQQHANPNSQSSVSSNFFYSWLFPSKSRQREFSLTTPSARRQVNQGSTRKRLFNFDIWNWIWNSRPVASVRNRTPIAPRFIPHGTLAHIQDQINSFSEFAGSAYENYEEVHEVVDAAMILTIIVTVLTIVGFAFVLWFTFLTPYVHLEVAKSLTCLTVVCCLQQYRRPWSVCFLTGVILIGIMFQYSDESYVEIHPSQMNNCKVYEKLDGCLRKSNIELLSSYYMITQLMNYCLSEDSDPSSKRCSDLSKITKNIENSFAKCGVEVLKDRSLVQNGDVSASLYKNSDTESSDTLKKFEYRKALNTQNKEALYAHMHFRLYEGMWWASENRLEIFKNNFHQRAKKWYGKGFAYCRNYLPILFPSLARPLLLMGSMNDGFEYVVDQFEFMFTTKNEIVNNYMPQSNKKGFSNIMDRKISLDSIVFVTQSYESTPQAASVLRNITTKRVDLDDDHHVEIKVLKGTLKVFGKTKHSKFVACPSIEQLKNNYVWDYISCPIVAECHTKTLDTLFNAKNPQFCPKYCSQTYLPASTQEVMSHGQEVMEILMNNLTSLQIECEESKRNIKAEVEDQYNLCQEQLEENKIKLQQCEQMYPQKRKFENTGQAFESRDETSYVSNFQNTLNRAENFATGKNNDDQTHNTNMIILTIIASLTVVALVQIIYAKLFSSDDDDNFSVITTMSMAQKIKRYAPDKQNDVKKALKDQAKAANSSIPVRRSTRFPAPRNQY